MRPHTAPHGEDEIGDDDGGWGMMWLMEQQERPVTVESGKRLRKKAKKKKKKLQKKNLEPMDHPSAKRLQRMLKDALARPDASRLQEQRHKTKILPKVDDSTRLAVKQNVVEKMARKADTLEIKSLQQDQTIEKLQAQLLEEKRKRKEMGGIKAYKILQNNTQKQIRILEDRLNAINIRTCDVEAQNNALIKGINDSRRERLTFERSYKKLQRAFKQKQRDMAKMLEQSNVAYEERQDALRQLQELAEVASKEEEDFAEEYSTLESMVAEQAQLQDFVNSSNLKKRERDLQLQIASGNLDFEEEERLKTKLQRLTQEREKQEQTISKKEKSMQTFEEAFGKLYESADTTNLNEIVERFVRNEDSNFALFNHIQFITRETEKEEDQLRHLEEEMQKYKKELGQNEGNRERIVKELEHKLERIRWQLKEVVTKIHSNEHTLKAVNESTENIFFRIGCMTMKGLEGFRSASIIDPQAAVKDDNNFNGTTNSEFQKQRSAKKMEDVVQRRTGMASMAVRLGAQVNEDNVMLYLGVIEQRTTELIQSFRAKNKDNLLAFKGAEKLSATGLPIPGHPKGAYKLRVHAPDCYTNQKRSQKGRKRGIGISYRTDIADDDDDYDEDDDDDEMEKPLSSEHLREMQMRESVPFSRQLNQMGSSSRSSIFQQSNKE